MPCDSVLARYVYDKPYHILIPSRSDWSTVPTHFGRKCSMWNTDGSKMGRNTGAGVYCSDERLEYSWSLGNYSTVFLAEVFAILMCCRICIGKGYRSRCIHICSDSQAFLLAFGRYNFTSHIVWECYSLLYQLCESNCVPLYWVPGHSGIQGNEVDDKLARIGSSFPFTGPKPPTGI